MGFSMFIAYRPTYLLSWTCIYVTVASVLICIGSTNSQNITMSGGNYYYEGRLEIWWYTSGCWLYCEDRWEWGTVCDDYFDMNDANVACRSMGYVGASHVWSSAHFGAGSGPIWLDDVNCVGHESHLWHCSTPGWGNNNCDHGEDVGVTCDIDHCSYLSPCQNGGACTDGVGTYTCSCVPGYSGTNCETIDSCTSKLGVEDGTIPSQDLSSSGYFASEYRPERGRLNTQADSEGDGAWCSGDNNANQWIQVDFGVLKQISGVITQGRSDRNKYVKTYGVLYSVDGTNFVDITDDNDAVIIFNGNSDQHTEVTNMLPSAVNAQYVRINPLTWISHVCLRFEILGCDAAVVTTVASTTTTATTTTTTEESTTSQLTQEPNLCDEPFGMESRKIPDEFIQASSSRTGAIEQYARMNESGWRPQNSDTNPWIQVQLDNWIKPVTGVITKGRQNGNRWVTTFEVLLSMNGNDWEAILDIHGNPKVFVGNSDSDTAVTNIFPKLALTRYVKFHQFTGNDFGISLRFEVLGCDNSQWMKSEEIIYGNMGLSAPWNVTSAECQSLGGTLPEGNEVDLFRHLDVYFTQNMPAIWGSHSSEWELIFKAVSEVTSNFTELYESGEGYRDGEYEAMSLDLAHRRGFVNPLLENWNDIGIEKVKVALYDELGETALVFNGVESDYKSFFQKQNLLTSPWTDLETTSTNYFSADGHLGMGRLWFINKQYGDCQDDLGWFVVKPYYSYCPWEDCGVFPCFIYSTSDIVENWKDEGETINLNGKTVSQSSVSFGGVPDLAIDGDHNTVFTQGSCTATDGVGENWWKIDLHDKYVITTVKIYNRDDCCSDRLIGAVIRVGMNEDNNLNTVCSTVTSDHVTNEPEIDIQCPYVPGQYVSVTTENTILTLCEVIIIATPQHKADFFTVSIQYSDHTQFCRKLKISDNYEVFSDDIPCSQEMLPAICKINADCSVLNGYCSHTCIVQSGKAVCTCPEQMVIGFDNLTCVIVPSTEESSTQIQTTQLPPEETTTTSNALTSEESTSLPPTSTQISENQVINVITCEEPMGMESYEIQDYSIQASSVQQLGTNQHRARLNSQQIENAQGGWQPLNSNSNQWIQVNLGWLKVITGVVTQGKHGGNKWVTEFEILFSMNGIEWDAILDNEGNSKVFEGNTDADTPVTNIIPNATLTRYVRLHPVSWHNAIALRFEIIGCYYSKWIKSNQTIYGNLQGYTMSWEKAFAGCDMLGGALLDGYENNIDSYVEEFFSQDVSAIWASYYSEWELIFKAVSQVTSNFTELYESSEGYRDGEYEAMSLDLAHRRSFVNPLLQNWNTIGIKKVKVALYDDKGQTALTFNGVGSDYKSFFQKQNLVSSPWTDLQHSETNYFSVEGHYVNSWVERSWFISKYYGGCEVDTGWFVVRTRDTARCDWEDCDAYPCFMYSLSDTSEAWGDGDNEIDLQGKPVSQSSQLNSASAERAIDGNTATAFSSGGSCTHTQSGGSQWWKIDLEEVYRVTAITIYNRGDCCEQRMVGAVIRVGLNATHTLNAVWTVVTSEQVANGPQIDLEFPAIRGQYVSVEILNTYLTICEIMIFSENIKEADFFTISIQYSDFTEFCRKLIISNTDIFSDDIPCSQETLPALCKINTDCSVMNGYCSHGCIAQSGEAVCTCPEPMTIGHDNLTCECNLAIGLCSHDCAIQSGEPVCRCPGELLLQPDGITCGKNFFLSTKHLYGIQLKSFEAVLCKLHSCLCYFDSG
ncbi:uncharacterized protein [Antedon mediterranea]|uniref:uncharacterized protein n=1 Tax=Antedon mediterranea TaxID=105859 RepID=UPI003AF945E0